MLAITMSYRSSVTNRLPGVQRRTTLIYLLVSIPHWPRMAPWVSAATTSGLHIQVSTQWVSKALGLFKSRPGTNERHTIRV